MSDLCADRFRDLADSLGGIGCESANPIGYLNDPRHLASATMTVIEVLILAGAVLAFAHAWRTFRVHGDATNLGVCLAAVAYVLVLEPPLYFPAVFGIDDYVAAVFVHNEFTVGFLYNRLPLYILPLYILLLYPALVYLAWTLVQRLGVRSRRGAFVTAVCVGAVHRGFYSIFDQFGPHHRWWAWDYEARVNTLRIDTVPMSSTVNFALVMPTAFAFLCIVLLGRRDRPTVRSVLLPAVTIGALTPLVSIPGQLPVTYLDLVDEPHTRVVTAILVVMLLGAAALTLREVLAARRDPTPRDEGFLGWYPIAYAGAWLVVFAGLWLSALPETLDAVGGLTDEGRPVGSPAYVAVCFVLSVVFVVAGRGRAQLKPPGGPTQRAFTSRAAGS